MSTPDEESTWTPLTSVPSTQDRSKFTSNNLATESEYPSENPLGQSQWSETLWYQAMGKWDSFTGGEAPLDGTTYPEIVNPQVEPPVAHDAWEEEKSASPIPEFDPDDPDNIERARIIFDGIPWMETPRDDELRPQVCEEEQSIETPKAKLQTPIPKRFRFTEEQTAMLKKMFDRRCLTRNTYQRIAEEFTNSNALTTGFKVSKDQVENWRKTIKAKIKREQERNEYDDHRVYQQIAERVESGRIRFTQEHVKILQRISEMGGEKRSKAKEHFARKYGFTVKQVTQWLSNYKKRRKY